MSINGFDDQAAPIVRRRRISLRFVAGAIVLAAALGLIATIALLIATTRGQPPRLVAADLAAAEERWKRHGPSSYDLDIQQSLGLSGEIHVEVRKGQTTAMTINGKAAPPRLWDSWSVPGLFEIIHLDLDRNSGVATEPQTATVFQQAEFDAESGLPRVYQRTELAGGQTVEWRIVSLRPLP
jgi:hypothetical protein